MSLISEKNSLFLILSFTETPLLSGKFDIKKRTFLLGPFKIWAGVDCLESLALNVSTCFAFVILSLGKSTSHSARSSLEPDKALLCCGSHPLIHINKKRLGDKLQPLFKKLGQGWMKFELILTLFLSF